MCLVLLQLYNTFILFLYSNSIILVRCYYHHIRLRKSRIREVKSLAKGHTTVTNNLNINHNVKPPNSHFIWAKLLEQNLPQ